MNFRRYSAIAIAIVVAMSTSVASASICVSESRMSGAVDLRGVTLCVDSADYACVHKAVGMLAGDIEAVTGVHPMSADGLSRRNVPAIVAGTIGRSDIIDGMIESGQLDVADITGGWERFVIRTVPAVGNDRPAMIVIAGSDRRGTAYGITTLSQVIGVDPWVWWADVPVERRPSLWVMADSVSQTPSVKYRGIFINDEDWGLYPWAARNYEKELGDIGPLTYARVCELLLRLRGNMLAPAMHDCTGAFYSHPESKQTVDDYGIIVTTSHCEPMLFNNFAPSEWNRERDGEWDYSTNRRTIFGKFDSRVAEAAGYENIYTVAMRGVHDEAIQGTMSTSQRVELLEQVISDQRGILRDRLDRDPQDVPQIFVPYKETLDLYRAGLRLPDDVTIVWPDDNYGYMKSLSTPAERARKGGAGVYYHTSYLGTPHDYLWLCTTPPALMYHELRKAFDAGADRYWLLNVGDIKPAEAAMQTFFDMAWDFSRFSHDNVNRHQAAWLAGIFGEDYKDALQMILDTYYRLAWSRKPEYMGWEIEWDSPENERLRPTEYSFANYNDARHRLADYRHISELADSIMSQLEEDKRAAFFEIVGYPVMASDMMNRKFLMVQLNGELAQAGDRAGANYAARLAREAADSIEALNRRYNTLLGGKWEGLMTVPPGYCAQYHGMPSLTEYAGEWCRIVDLSVDHACDRLDGCHTVDLTTAVITQTDHEAGVRLIEGVGYDWTSLCLGDALGCEKGGHVPQVSFELPACEADTVSVHLYSLPFFPVYEGRGMKTGISFDGEPEVVTEYLPEEWSPQWKENVLRNSAVAVVKFPVDKTLSHHTLTIRGIDPGAMVQRVVLDYGGLLPSYVGPSPAQASK